MTIDITKTLTRREIFDECTTSKTKPTIYWRIALGVAVVGGVVALAFTKPDLAAGLIELILKQGN